MKFVDTPGFLPWLERLRAKPVKTRNQRQTIRYYSAMYQATPRWLSAEDKKEIRRIYRLGKRIGKSVDHIIPLKSEIVCGLHVPWNLQLLTAQENYEKSNKWWPDCPYDQSDLPF